VCEDCIDRHMNRKHGLYCSGFPHPKAQETAEIIGAKMEGKTGNWCAEFYCENQACDVREVTIRVKEFNYDPLHVRGPFRCPNCADGLKFHWVRKFGGVERTSGGSLMSVPMRMTRSRAIRCALTASGVAGRTLPRTVME
jgi:hypothetical protein